MVKTSRYCCYVYIQRRNKNNITCIYTANNSQISWPMILLLSGGCRCVSEILAYTNLDALNLSNCLLEFGCGGGHHSLPGEDWVCTSLISGSYDLRINLTARRQDTHIKTQIESNVFREQHILLDFVFCLTLPTLGRPRMLLAWMHQENSIIFYVPKLKYEFMRGVSIKLLQKMGYNVTFLKWVTTLFSYIISLLIIQL